MNNNLFNKFGFGHKYINYKDSIDCCYIYEYDIVFFHFLWIQLLPLFFPFKNSDNYENIAIFAAIFNNSIL